MTNAIAFISWIPWPRGRPSVRRCVGYSSRKWSAPGRFAESTISACRRSVERAAEELEPRGNGTSGGRSRRCSSPRHWLGKSTFGLSPCSETLSLTKKLINPVTLRRIKYSNEFDGFLFKSLSTS